LVRSVRRNGPHFAIEVAYGTSQTHKDFYSSFYVGNLVEMNAAGLFHPTRFELANPLLLPWSEEFFIQRPDGVGPIVGRFSDAQIALCSQVVKILRGGSWNSN
jgi:hypothetical protein